MRKREIDNNRIEPSESIHEFFVMVPVILDDLPLTMVERALYFHILRRSSPTGRGVCYETTKNMAIHLGVSKDTITKAKKGLEKKGLIIITKEKGSHGEFPHDVIKVVDLWDLNSAWKETDKEERELWMHCMKKTN